MKNKIIYISIFLAAFVVTSAAIIYFNSKYANIFKFDFSPAGAFTLTADSLNNSGKNQNDSLFSKSSKIDSVRFTAADSLPKGKTNDSLFTSDLNKIKDTTKTAKLPDKENKSGSVLQAELNPKKETAPSGTIKADKIPAENLSKKVPLTENYLAPPGNSAPGDTLYTKWMKSTAKLYENMEPKKAAKIISSYSDNMARDIIYTMKKKKAADILAELNPEFASRITRMK